MKWVTFHPGQGQPRIGIIHGDRIIDLPAACRRVLGQQPPWCIDMLAALDAWDEATSKARAILQALGSLPDGEVAVPIDRATLLAPVPRPRSLRDCMGFERHVAQAMRGAVRRSRPWLAAVDAVVERLAGRGILRPPAVWYERPIYYKGNPASVVGPDADVVWPSFTTQLDYELEFGVIVGRRGRDIPVESAHRHIAGYLIFNDFSARDVQIREMAARLGPAKGKDFDTGNAMGPWLVTPDEIPNPKALRMTARINGELWSEGRSGDMAHSFDEVLAFISRDETLFPGDFVGSGAVPNGCGLELNRWLRVGDVVELEVEGLGVLRNRIARAPGAHSPCVTHRIGATGRHCYNTSR